MKMEWHVCLTMALLAVAHNGRAQFPGTPTTNWINPGTQTLIIGESVDTGIQPIDVAGAGTSFSNTIPGDVVLLTNPNGGTNTSNWAAVVSFFNPADPTGTNNLAAIDDQAFFPVNGSNSFLNFLLLPNTLYIPEGTTNADGSIIATYTEFGPVAGILAGQQAIFSTIAYPYASPVPEPGTVGLMGLGSAALALGVWRRRKRL